MKKKDYLNLINVFFLYFSHIIMQLMRILIVDLKGNGDELPFE